MISVCFAVLQKYVDQPPIPMAQPELCLIHHAMTGSGDGENIKQRCGSKANLFEHKAPFESFFI